MKNLNDIIKKAMVTSGGLLMLAGCSSAYTPPENRITQIKDPIRLATELKQFPDIKWIMDRENDNTIYGKQPDDNKITSLEDALNIQPSPDATRYGLNEWTNPTLARIIPLKEMIEEHSSHYNINPVWATMFFHFESMLQPADYNRFSEDFGLGQIKRDSEVLAKAMGKMENSIFYSPDLDKDKSIFDPETNIIMALMLHRYNIARYGLTNSDQAYAVYVRGTPGLTNDGELSNITIDLLNGFHSRYDAIASAIPMFTLNDREINDLENKDTRTLLQIHNTEANAKEKYSMMLDYFTDSLIKDIDGSARSVLSFSDCVAFATTLDKSYGVDQSNNYAMLEVIGDNIRRKVDNRDLKNRINNAIDRLEFYSK